jgi:uncharacterized MAPEG superfamily protein
VDDDDVSISEREAEGAVLSCSGITPVFPFSALVAVAVLGGYTVKQLRNNAMLYVVLRMLYCQLSKICSKTVHSFFLSP